MKDLYQFVNGPWLQSHVIPDDRGVDGTFHNLRDEAEELVHEIVKMTLGAQERSTHRTLIPRA